MVKSSNPRERPVCSSFGGDLKDLEDLRDNWDSCEACWSCDSVNLGSSFLLRGIVVVATYWFFGGLKYNGKCRYGIFFRQRNAVMDEDIVNLDLFSLI